MKITRFTSVAALGAVAALSLAGCAANEGGSDNGGDAANGSESSSTLEGTINASGASSQTAAQEAWVAAFQTENSGAEVIYEPTGSGVGRDNFLAGASNFIGSDRAFDDDEVAAGGFGACTSDDIVEVPAYISPVAVAFNLDGIDALNLDADTIAGIFAGEITNWDDDAIAATNDGVDLPDLPIEPVHRSDPSGTQETFVTYLSAAAPDVWTYEVSDEWPSDLKGASAQGTSGVVQSIKDGVGTIGFADASQVGELGQTHVEVDGDFVPYSAEAASKLVENSPLVEGRGDHDLVFDVDPSTATDGAYPIALVSYLIGCEQYEDATVAGLVKAYFEYVASAEAQDAAAENAGSAPISDSLREQVLAAIDGIQVG